MRGIQGQVLSGITACALIVSGCTSTLVRDEVTKTAAPSRHCTGSEWADRSSVAVLPVPVVAFFVPHFDLHQIQTESYLNRCGDSRKLINREVSIDRSACIPAGLTRIITLGIWQWCPTHVDWAADLPVEAALPSDAAPPSTSAKGPS